MGVVALVLASALFLPGDYSKPDVEDATGKARAGEIARRFLRVNGVDPTDWRSITYDATGFPDDEAARGYRAADVPGVPLYSDEAARYVIEKGGPEAFRKLTESELPLAYWVVRFFRPEQKEEWKVLIDARRSRVVAFLNIVAEDAPAEPTPAADEARRRALAAAEKLGYPAAAYSIVDVGTKARPKRVDTTVVLEAKPPGIGDARPRLTAVFQGPRLSYFVPTIHIPESFLREERRRTAVDWLLLAVRVVAGGALVGLAVVLFLRSVKRPEFRWKEIRTPLICAGVLAIAGLANTAPAAFRRYETEQPFALFRLGLMVSLIVGFAVILLGALIGFVLLSGARPGWASTLRRRGSLGDAFLRAAIAAAGLLGLIQWVHVITSRLPAVYQPDPNLPSSLQFAVPAVEVLWTAARGAFLLAVAGAVAALALRTSFFRTTIGRALGVLAILVAIAPASLRSPVLAASEFIPSALLIAWLAASAAFLLRGHGAAWALFGIFTFGGREVLSLIAQPASADQAAGWLGALLLAIAAAALLLGRRAPELPTFTSEGRTAPPEPPAPPPPAPEPTTPSSGSA
jgi:hypothetical protein